MMEYRHSEPSKLAVAYQWVAARLVATLLVASGVGILVGAASLSPQPTPGQAALLALFASAFNIWGGAQFAKIGKVDSKHARSAVRRLYTVGTSLNVAAADLQESLLLDDDPHEIAGRTQVLLSQVQAVQLHLADAIGDWDDVHQEALREVFRGHDRARKAREGAHGE